MQFSFLLHGLLQADFEPERQCCFARTAEMRKLRRALPKGKEEGVLQKEKQFLSKKELYFCRCYVDTGNKREAALRAGYTSMPDQEGERLLAKKSVADEIERMYSARKSTLNQRALSGYERLAFGGISDAIRILYSDGMSRNELDGMDLFNIAEIKRPREGAMEIKFFDRLRALEKIEQAQNSEEKGELPFYKALRESAEVFNRSSEDGV